MMKGVKIMYKYVNNSLLLLITDYYLLFTKTVHITS